MDLLFEILIFVFAVLVIAFPIVLPIIILVRRRSMSAGEEGEYYAARQLRRLNDKEYFVINDLLFRKRNGFTSQIDHVVVSPYGVFVIETKNIYGYIHGKDQSKLWRSYWRDGRDMAFDNPVLQNEAHIMALEERLGVGRQIPYYSIIAFTPTADLQVRVTKANVIYWTQLRKLIRAYKEPVMSIEEAQSLYNEIVLLNITDPEVRSSHAQSAQARKDNFERHNDEALDNGKCPRCGGNLVRRTGTYGAFYGCSNYPNCKYTHPAY